MTTSMDRIVRNSTGLAKTNPAVQTLARRLEKARQMRDERVARADADYVETVRRALADVEPVTTDTAIEPSMATEQDSASA